MDKRTSTASEPSASPNAHQIRAGKARARTATRGESGKFLSGNIDAVLREADKLGRIDPDSPVGLALAEWRQDLVRQLGGSDAVSPAQIQIIDMAARTKLMLDSIDSWILHRGQAAVIYKKGFRVRQIVKDRTYLANVLAGWMSMLGLKQQAPPIKSLQEILQSKPEPPGEPPCES